MENLTDEQREIARLEIQLDLCKRDKDALRYQLNEAKREAAEHSTHLTAFWRRLAWLFFGAFLMAAMVLFIIGVR